MSDIQRYWVPGLLTAEDQKKQGRTAWLTVTYQGQDITKDVSRSIVSFTANDNAAYVSDDISLTLQDRERLWLEAWFPEHGDIMSVAIQTRDWRWPEDEQVLDLGSFLMDEPEYTLSPSSITLRGTSIPRNRDFTDTERDQVWKSINLSTVAGEIANRAGMELLFDSAINPLVQRQDQSGTPDMEFLCGLCQRFGVAFKVTNNSIVIYDFATYEAKPPALTIYRDSAEIQVGGRLRRNQAFTAARLKNSDKNNKKMTYTFADPNKTELPQKLLELDESCSGQAEMQLVAKGRLREINAQEYAVALNVVGNTALVAGVTIDLADFGNFDGTYFVDKVRYTMKPFVCGIEAHRVLGW